MSSAALLCVRQTSSTLNNIIRVNHQKAGHVTGRCISTCSHLLKRRRCRFNFNHDLLYSQRHVLPSTHILTKLTHHQSSTAHATISVNNTDLRLRYVSAYNPELGIDWTKSRSFHTTSLYYAYDKEESKLEKTVKALKQEAKELKDGAAKLVPDTAPPKEVATPSKSLVQRIGDVIKHYYHGFRLLFIDIKVCFKHLRKVLNGKTLSRRERKQLVRTTADMFRLVPFLVFIIIPFMELLLPVALALFPGMLPSTFAEDKQKKEKFRKNLKVKLEMAKFLQDTIEESAIQGKGKTDHASEFAKFIEKVRQSGAETTNEEILKFSKLFEDELTLDNLHRGQLIALCKLLELNTIGTNNFLLFQLRMQLRQLKTDDKMIIKEGLESLTIWELQEACRARGMRALGMSEIRLRGQLQQWLDLHIQEQIPPSLLLLSRTLYLPEALSTEDQLKATISALPETTAEKAKLNVQEVTGEMVDNKAKLELIKQEEEAIKAEEVEKELEAKLEEAKKEVPVEATPDVAPVIETMVKEELVDTAPVLEDIAEPVVVEKIEEVSTEDLKEIEEALDIIAEEKQFDIEKEELEELKEEVIEYQEDLEEMKELVVASGGADEDIKESKGAVRLRKKVNKMISQLDNIIEELHEEKETLIEDIEVGEVRVKRNVELKKDETKRQEVLDQISEKKGNMIEINDLILAMKRLQKVPDEAKLQKIADVLDEDHDGNIDVSHAMKVIELLGKENIKVDSEKMSEIGDLLKREADLEEEEKLQEKLEKEESKNKEKDDESAKNVQ